MIKSIARIRALVKYDWDHANHKFKPGDRVVVNEDGALKYNANTIRSRVGSKGNVLAVSVYKDYNVRHPKRMYTRYYVQFDDGAIIGVLSQHLDEWFVFNL
tara:strand:+ start:93 stop:395 length:303 start_codon:yes stop_codon:yes gene_type:complete